jgi:ribosomal protein S18 acetylase RimI-like enzyme
MTGMNGLRINFSELALPDFTVSRLTMDDVENIQKFLETCSDYSILENGRPPQAGDSIKLMTEVPPNKPFEDKFLFAIENKNTIAAILDVLLGYPGENILWIGLLLIHPDMRGKGLGRKIIQSLTEVLKRTEFTEIQLGVLKENQAGYKFWQNIGFQQIDLKPARQFGHKTHTVIVMAMPVKKRS